MNILDLLNSDNFLQRFAELITVNGGPLPQKIVQNPEKSDKNRYGRIGLTIEEMIELQYRRGVFEGILTATNNKYLAQAQEALRKESTGTLIQIASVADLNLFLQLGKL